MRNPSSLRVERSRRWARRLSSVKCLDSPLMSASTRRRYMDTEHGIDLDDLDPQHSLTTDPTVVQLRTAAQLLGDDMWIAVKLPGEYDDDLDDDAAIRRWTTVVLYPDELGWLREALALNAEDDTDPD